MLFLPDQYLAGWVASQTDVEIVTWEGACEVHERFTGPELAEYRTSYPGVQIIAHPECPPDVLAEADFVGSTSGMTKWVQTRQPEQVVMVTECSMADNVAESAPDTEFLRPCNMCPPPGSGKGSMGYRPVRSATYSDRREVSSCATLSGQPRPGELTSSALRRSKVCQ